MSAASPLPAGLFLPSCLPVAPPPIPGSGGTHWLLWLRTCPLACLRVSCLLLPCPLFLPLSSLPPLEALPPTHSHFLPCLPASPPAYLPAEDALGDMDFKVAGDETGITAFQLDIKVEGITLEILGKALAEAAKGRRHILAEMARSVCGAAVVCGRGSTGVWRLSGLPWLWLFLFC